MKGATRLKISKTFEGEASFVGIEPLSNTQLAAFQKSSIMLRMTDKDLCAEYFPLLCH
jgi:hypothetical protein